MKAPSVARNGLIVTEPHRLIGLWSRIIVLVGVTLIPISLELLRIDPPWRLDWFDMLSRTVPRDAVPNSPVRVVVLQDAPGGEHLQGTSPRDRLARLMDIIGYSGAKAIGVDVPLDGVGIYELVEERAEVGPPLVKSRAPAEAFARHPVVAPITLHDAVTPQPDITDPLMGESLNLQAVLAALPEVRHAPVSVPAHPLIRNAANAEGLLIDDLHSEERLRTLPMVRVQEQGGVPRAAFHAMAIQMVALGQKHPAPTIQPAILADRMIHFDDSLRVPIDAEGNLRLYLRGIDPELLIDGDDVLLERTDPAQFP